MQTQSGLSSLCSQTRLSDQASNPCVDSNFPFGGFILNKIIGKEYEETCQTIMERLNWNMPFGSACYPVIVGGNCYRLNEVGCIINNYTNHAIAGHFPAYNPADAVTAQTIINTVQRDTDRPFHKVKAVLDQLYYGVKDGTVKSAQLLDPVRYKNNAVILDIPTNVSSGVRDTKAIFDNALTYAKYGLYGAVGLGVLYLGSQAYGAFKTVKGAA